LRALAKEIAESRSVMIVDPDGEIGGGGVRPHGAVGDARWVAVAVCLVTVAVCLVTALWLW
jgi:hypothetical protein